LAEVSRASFYRSLKERAPEEEDVEVRSAVHQVVLEHRRRYGSRRVTAALRRRGMVVNRKRIARIMQEDNLLAVQPRSFVVTTDSEHELEVYLNVASRMKVKGVNQLWVADITYIRLKTEFVYLAVILDAHSRKVAGWELDETLATRLRLPPCARDCEAEASARFGASLRSRRAIRFGRLCGRASQTPNDSEHEPASQSVRQCELRKLHKDAQT